MRISRKAEYAVRAVLDLSLHAPTGGSVRSADIAKRTGVPDKFLEAILLDLRKAGVVASKRGPEGGHWLARDPSKLTVASVLSAIDGPLTATPRKERRVDGAADACLAALFRSVDEAVLAVVSSTTFDDLRKQASVHAPLDFAI